MRPSQSEGHDAPRLIDELVPGLATMVDETHLSKAAWGINRGAVPREPQAAPLRKRKRVKVFTAADSTPIQARIPNAMYLEIERAARHELVSIADFVRAALLEKLKRGRDKNET